MTEHLPAGESFPVWKLAQLFHVSAQHLVDLIEEGEIVAFDLRGKTSSRACIRVQRAELIKFLQSREITATGKTRESFRVLAHSR